MTAPAVTATPGASLPARLDALRQRVAALVADRAAGDPTADDPLRGLYISPDTVRRLLDGPPHENDGLPDGAEAPSRPVPPEPAPGGDRFAALAARCGLTATEQAILLLALAPDVDRSFETLYGYLNDDVSRRRASTGLALDLCGLSAADPGARARFHASAPLVRLGLLRVDEPEAPFLGRVLRVPDRLVAHLLGDDTPDPVLAGLLGPVPAAPPDALTERLAALLTRPLPPLTHLRERREGDGLASAGAALAAAGREALHCAPPEDGELPAEALLLEARLRDAVLVVSPLPAQAAALVRTLGAGEVPLVLTGQTAFDPEWGAAVLLDAPPAHARAAELWARALGTEPDFDLAATVAPYRLPGARVRRAAASALELAAFDGTPLTAAHLRRAARHHTSSGLEQHARRIVPDVGWDDLVLPPDPLSHLRELALRCRYREQVLGDWRLSAGGGRGRGVLALFAGESGTGKTLSAEVIAYELGLDLYVVQLSSVVDKYVGETEKNLERIFAEADRTDAVLLFDEADAVFGKRSEVKSSHDKYANMESAYLLQRLEAFDGIAVLTTNLRANIDDAFTRRLDLIVDFPFPDEEQRRALWRHSLTHVPHAPDLDPGSCARDFELAGGAIRSAVVTAAYAAAARGDKVTAADLRTGAVREYRKAGRIVMEDVGW
ncbi:ATP-binding protein [Streptomyces sp. GZWMJZ-114]|uniref:ATP-binding protein n=1 Tax=Streptomyces sp. GZWMJZ-114 TaxID=2494734 RepID=UPI00101174DE|nr:ATP-binding protein [Streptomyces sp. GZWMJZ-114]